jgi:DnaJ family protein A protein 2
MEDANQIIIARVGDEAPELAAGDLVFELRMRHHDTFTRRGDNLLAVKPIGLAQALLGGAVSLRHLDRRLLLLRGAPGRVIAPGAIKVVDGEGMPVRGSHRRRRNLFIRFSVALPDPAQITPALRDASLRVIPAINEEAGVDPDAENVFVTMTDSDIAEFANATSNREEAYRDGWDEAGEGSGETCRAV